jgi:hypothetical protein
MRPRRPLHAAADAASAARARARGLSHCASSARSRARAAAQARCAAAHALTPAPEPTSPRTLRTCILNLSLLRPANNGQLACTQPAAAEHGDAHAPAVACAAYEATRAEENASNAALLRETTRPCPQCGAAIEKAGGCNQMT